MTDRQHRSYFIHGIAVSSRTDVGIVSTWAVKAQLCTNAPDEGFHPGGASANTHKLHISKQGWEIVSASGEIEMIENVFFHFCYVWI